MLFTGVFERFGILKKTVLNTVDSASSAKRFIYRTGEQHAVLIAVKQEMENAIYETDAALHAGHGAHT